jgi:predicted nucleotidyltransferase
MDTIVALKNANVFIDPISKLYQIESAALFGSFAKVTNHPDSNIDIAIAFNNVDDIIYLQNRLMQRRSDEDLLIEPHPFTISDFIISNLIAAEIKRNGIEMVNTAA